MRRRTARRPGRLVIRIFAASAAVIVVAVTAASWVTVAATTVAVRQQQQESLQSDARIYRALLGYASSHPTWGSAGPLLRGLARDADTSIAVTDLEGRVLVASSSSVGSMDPRTARERLDPLAVDPALAGQQAPSDDEHLRAAAVVRCDAHAVCTRHTVAATVAIDSRIVIPNGRRFWVDLDAGVTRCLGGRRSRGVSTVSMRFAVESNAPGAEDAVIAGCIDAARRSLLEGTVAPPSLLHLGTRPTASVFWDLSPASRYRIGLAAAGVLGVSLLLSLLLARTIAGPLRAMAAVADRAAEGDTSARARTSGAREIAAVARAFNGLADRRQQLEEARTTLMNDVSHELRNPLTNVRGRLEAAQDGIVPTDAALVDDLLEEADHLQRLVDDLHDLALGDTGRRTLQLEQLALRPLLEAVARAFGPRAIVQQVGIEVDCAPTVEVRADRVRLQQAVSNLVANSLRYTPSGGRIVLRGGDGVVQVSDDGAGVPADHLPHVFDRFHRVDGSRARSTGGSGLGLAIVRQIMQEHGGQATMASEVGRGTTVTLALPASET